MIEINPLWLILLSEAVLALTALGLVMGILSLRKRKSDRQAIQVLIKTIKESDDLRQQEIRHLLADKYKYAGDELEHTAKMIKQGETEFYQSFISLYLKRNPGDAVKFNSRVFNLSEPYRNLKIPEPEFSTDVTTATAEESGEILELRQQNQRLTDQLQISQDTMDKMLHEYASMYDHGKPSEQTQDEMKDQARTNTASKKTHARSS